MSLRRDTTRAVRAGVLAAAGTVLLAGLLSAGVARAEVIADDRTGASDIVLVKVDPLAPSSERARVRAQLGAGPGEMELLPGGWRAYRVDRPLTARQARARIGETPAVARVEINHRIAPVAIPNDPSWSQLWGLANIRAPEAWDAAGAVGEVVVAVADTGVQVSHPDLSGAIWTNRDEIPGNNVDDDRNGYVDDVHGWDFHGGDNSVYDGVVDAHGTHVAGTIAAIRNNRTGIAGVTANVKIMPVKFIGPREGSIHDAMKAIQYAVANGATAINASWGGEYSSAICDAVRSATDRGVAVISAAGNSQIGGSVDIDVDRPTPAACPAAGNITVGALAADNTAALFSNHGDSLVDIAAPGSRILSTLPGGYGLKDGTSMAAPHVAGAVGLLRGLDPRLTPAQVERRVRETATVTPTLKGLSNTAARLDMMRLVESTLATRVSPGAPTPVGPAHGAMLPTPSVTFEWRLPELDPNGVTGYELIVDGAVVARTPATVTSARVSLADGHHAWAVRALGSNVPGGRETSLYRLVIDRAPPVGFAVSAPATTRLARPTVTWRAIDASSSIAAYEVYVNGAQVIRGGPELTSYRIPTLPLGRNTVRVVAYDALAHERHATVTIRRTTPGAALTAERVLVRARRGAMRAVRGRIRVPIARSRRARTVVVTFAVLRNGRRVRLQSQKVRVAPRARYLTTRPTTRVLKRRGRVVMRWRGTVSGSRRWSGRSIPSTIRRRALVQRRALAAARRSP